MSKTPEHSNNTNKFFVSKLNLNPEIKSKMAIIILSDVSLMMKELKKG
jgi:hypothetical protein